MLRLMCAILCCLNALFSSAVSAAIVDVSQTVYQGVADVSQGDRSGQTFNTTRDGFLAGIRLYVRGGSWGPSYPAGSDLTVRLRALGANGVPLESPLAIGILSRAEVDRDIAKWVDIWFDAPYVQSTGEKLAFMVHDATSGSEGWTDFGMQSGNPYAGGQQFHLNFFDPFATSALSANNTDFAFETLLVPEPSAAACFLTGMLVLRRGRTTRHGVAGIQ
jgi:hypothetical protein